ncbi:MYND-type zinc finger-containing chromatin reader ZMYND8-like, partial [Sitodiplosis mosellana]|uniref:MYND-type zinc finger-containing chromatin reader ZMYND8-like n=1 Tax=Sitodiplosis mosellana TaxID=263140 RepID=UPI0024440979
MNADQSNNQTVRRDKFCWICHKKYLKISCAKCFRIFHDKCLKSADNYRWGNKSETKLASCTVCTVEETSKKACDDKDRLLKLLKYIMIDILDNPDFRVFKDLSALKMEAKYCDDVVNPIDLDEIDRKICRELYDSLYAFLVDIDYIYHNCFVYYG